MNKKEEIIIFVSITIVIILAILFNILKREDKPIFEDNYRLIYHESNLIYDMTITNVIKVDVKEQVQCIKAPCDPVYMKSYEVPYEKKYKDFFNELFEDNDTNTLDITRNDIGYADYAILSEITSKYKVLKSHFKYKTNNFNDSNYGTRGYYLEKTNNETRVVIAMGEKNTGGYSIDLQNVEVVDNDVKITVEETFPGRNDTVTMAFTYPCVEVVFPFEVKNISVINTSNQKFYLIKK